MPRVYKRKTDARPYCNYTIETLNEALAAVANGESVRSAAKRYKIPHATLQRKVNGKYNSICKYVALACTKFSFKYLHFFS